MKYALQPDPHKRDLAAGAALIKSFEDCELTAYWDKNGKVWTIGWGTTKGVKKGMRISQARADQLFNADFYQFCSTVQRAIAVSVNDNEFSALVSLAYNIGSGNFNSSTLLKKLNAGVARSEVSKWFAPWNKSGGEVLRGLTRRRAAEAALFMKPVVTVKKKV